jgi:hypothetical protein
MLVKGFDSSPLHQNAGIFSVITGRDIENYSKF